MKKSSIILIFLFSVLILTISAITCSYGCLNSSSIKVEKVQPLPAEIHGIWIRLPTDEKEIPRILDNLTTAHFNIAFIETFYHGFTIYPSNVFPERPELMGKDLLQSFINEAQLRHIEVHCWLEVLYWRPTPETNFPQTPVLRDHSDWFDLDIHGKTTEGFELNHYFVNPAIPGVRQKITTLVHELCTRYPINGINLDYMRYAAGTSEFGYNSYAIDKFKTEFSYDPKTIDKEKDKDKWLTWSRFREHQVTELVALISHEVKQSKKEMKLSAAVFPDYYKNRYSDSRLQDWAPWCEKRYLDFVTPMCYNYSLNGIREEIKISQLHAASVPVYPGLAALAGTKHPEISKQIQVAREAGCNGEVVFCYSWLTTFPNIFQNLGNGIYSK